MINLSKDKKNIISPIILYFGTNISAYKHIFINKKLLFEVTIFPAVEKHLSELTDVAGIARYFFVYAATFLKNELLLSSNSMNT
jgi:hypothetical protein